VGDTSQGACTACGDGTEPNHLHTSCDPCRPGTSGTAGVCETCSGGQQPSLHSCIDKCHLYTTQTDCVAQQSSGCVYNAFQTPTCASSSPTLQCGNINLGVAGGVGECQGSSECEYLPARVTCEPCAHLTYSTAGICEKCPIGYRPSADKNACVPMPAMASNAISPTAVVEYSSTATFLGEFSTSVVLPSIAGIAESFSDRTLAVQTTASTLAQNATFTLNFFSLGTSGVSSLPSLIKSQASRVRRNFEVGMGGVTMLVNSIGSTLNVPPADVTVKRIKVGELPGSITFWESGSWFTPPSTQISPVALDPSPSIATISLAGDMYTIGVVGAPARLMWERDFVLALSTSIGVPASRITIAQIQSGSIVVTVKIFDAPNAAVSATQGLTSLLNSAASGSFTLSGYSVLDVSETNYGPHACAAIPGMSTCTNGACVASNCTQNTTGVQGRRMQTSQPHRHLQSAGETVSVSVEVQVAGAQNIAPLLNNPGFGAGFAAVLASEGMQQDNTFSGACSCPASDASGLCTNTPTGLTATEPECIFQEFVGRRFATDLVFLSISDPQGNTYGEPYDRPSHTDAGNLELCKEICFGHVSCTAFVFQPSAGRNPRVSGCSFAQAAIVSSVPAATDICTAGVSCGIVDATNPAYYNLYVRVRQWVGAVESSSYTYEAVNVTASPQHISTVMPYTLAVTMHGEDSAGVTSTSSMLSDVSLFSSVLSIAANVLNINMQVIDATPVVTSFSTTCSDNQWFADPYCYNCTVCELGTEKTAECTPTSNAVCTPCGAVDGRSTHYSTDGLNCFACDSECVGGTEYEEIRCTPLTNRVCKRCPRGTVASRVCDWKQLSRAQPVRFDDQSQSWRNNPLYKNMGWYTCPYKCLGNQLPKLQRTYGVKTANFPDGHPRAQAVSSHSRHARHHGDGFYGFTCKGRDATGQMMFGKTSAGRICAPQKNMAEYRPAQASNDSSSAVVAGHANDGDQFGSCVCIRDDPVAWWSVELHKPVTNATVYLHANDCCEDETTAPRPKMTVSIGSTSTYGDAVECGSYTPSGSKTMMAVVSCIGTGHYVFVSSPGKLALAEVQLFNVGQLDIGIGHPREWKSKAARNGRYVDDSPDGLTSKLGTYALGTTPHHPFFERFSNEFQTAGQQHVWQEHHLVGEYTNRPVYTGTHLTSSDCTQLAHVSTAHGGPVTGGTSNLSNAGVHCGRTSRVWNHTEEGPYGSQQTFGPTGMHLGMVEVLTDYTRDNPIWVSGHPVSAEDAYYISSGQRPGQQTHTPDTPWEYVEEFGWLMDKNWFNANVRSLPQSVLGKRQSELTVADTAEIIAEKARLAGQSFG